MGVQLVHWVGYIAAAALSSILVNLLYQILPKKHGEPPLVFHWLPFVGNAVEYGLDPHHFFIRCQKKHGDLFTFVLLGRKITCYLGVDGNDFVLNGRLQDVSAEAVYGPLTTPVFGSGVVFDCPNAKLMEQKKFVKFGLSQAALEAHVPRIEAEVVEYIESSCHFGAKHPSSLASLSSCSSGTVDIASAMAEITIFTAGRALQGDEVRGQLTAEFASLYHDLDRGFSPINFLFPWAPLPHNRRRDAAHARMREVYMDIIRARRKKKEGKDGRVNESSSHDMIWNLMRCRYKDGRPVPDREIAHMMITLLMAGQHSSSSAGSWIMLRLASRPDVAEALYEEQVRVLGEHCYDGDGSSHQKSGQHHLRLPPMRYADLDRLPLLRGVVRETLRVNPSIHSLMRMATNPLPVSGTPYVVPRGRILLASPLITSLGETHFVDAQSWDPRRWEEGGNDDNDDDDDKNTNDSKAKDGSGKSATASKGAKSPYLPFGAGRHRCIGEKFAYLNLEVIVATLVRRFRFSTVDGSETVPPTDYSSLFSRPSQPATIRWERRGR